MSVSCWIVNERGEDISIVNGLGSDGARYQKSRKGDYVERVGQAGPHWQCVTGEFTMHEKPFAQTQAGIEWYTFKPGEHLFTADGAAVVFDHAHGEDGYVRPLLTIIMQTSTYSGDDFNEEEDLTEASYLISVPLTDLSRDKPVARVDAEIRTKLMELERIKAETTATQRAGTQRLSELKRQLTEKEQALALWATKHPAFEDTFRFLEGLPMFPLHAAQNPYHKAPNIPSIPKPDDIRLLKLRPASSMRGYVRQKGRETDAVEWVAVDRDGFGEREKEFMFFHSEKERDAHITALFNKALTVFRERPNYREDQFSTNLDFGALVRWTQTYTFLAIPEDIVKAKEEHERAIKDAERAKLLRQLKELGQ